MEFVSKEKALSNINYESSSIYDELASSEPLKFDSLDKNRTTIIVIDIINGFVKCGPLADTSIESIIPPVNNLLRKACDNGLNIVNFVDSHTMDSAEFSSFAPHCIEGTEESQLVDELAEYKKYDNFFEIKKNSTNGFNELKFQQGLLVHSHRNTFIVVGDCTDICVMQFCLSLKAHFNKENKPYRVIVPINCVDTFNCDFHNKDFYNLASLKLLKNMGIEIVKEII